jgi:Anti-sigma-D factor RsdA to sigma factor binding region
MRNQGGGGSDDDRSVPRRGRWRKGRQPDQGAPGQGPGAPSGRVNGVHPEGLYTQPIVFSDIGDEPVDLMAVQADDALIDAIAAGRPLPGTAHGHRADDRITRLLQAWRDDVVAEPMRPLVTGAAADAALRAGRRTNATGPRHSAPRPSMRTRHLIPLAGAAAALTIMVSGVALGAHGAKPGDPLWNVSKVLYSDRATSVEKKVEVESRLDKVKTALTQGRTDDARKELAAAGTDLTVVRSEEGKETLAEQQAFLTEKVEQTPPGTAVNPAELEQPAPARDPRRRPPPSSVPPSSAVPPSPSSPPTTPTHTSSGNSGTGSTSGQPPSSNGSSSSNSSSGSSSSHGGPSTSA